MEKEFLHELSKDARSVYFILFPEAEGVVKKRGQSLVSRRGEGVCPNTGNHTCLRLTTIFFFFLRNKALLNNVTKPALVFVEPFADFSLCMMRNKIIL